MSDEGISAPARQDLLEGHSGAHRDAIMKRFREGVQETIAEQLAAGCPIFFGGVGDEAGKLFMRTPDGRRFEYRLRADGVREIVRELPR